VYEYEEYTIKDEDKIAAVVSGEKSLTDSGILAELNTVCADRCCEIDWSFTMGFPKVFMLRKLLEKNK
jgi:hypothetical protein